MEWGVFFLITQKKCLGKNHKLGCELWHQKNFFPKFLVHSQKDFTFKIHSLIASCKINLL